MIEVRWRTPPGWLVPRAPASGEGEVVLWAFGRRIRIYAGHTYRIGGPILNRWDACGHSGIVVRLRRDGRYRRCFGIQWRPAERDCPADA